MLKMILADDEPVISRGIQKLVDWEQLGIEIVGVYEDGRCTMEGILKLRPDIALLDISMPGMTGVEILRELAGLEDVHTQVIFISGFQDFEYAKSALKYGAKGYLLKPVIEEELLQTIETCMNHLRTEQQKPEFGTGKEQVSVTRAEDYSRLIEVEKTSYQPVYAEVLFDEKESPQMRKLIRFSFMSFLEEYMEQTGAGIVFTSKDNIVLVLKGMEREQAKEKIFEIWEKSRLATGHNTAFILGNMVESMELIPKVFQECLEMKGYFFFIEEIQVPILYVGERVFLRQTGAEELENSRKEVLDAIIAQDEAAFGETLKRFSHVVCITADGRKEDACYYYCSMIRMLKERFASIGVEACIPELKELMETGRSSTDYEVMTKRYGDYLRKSMGLLQTSVVSNEKKDIIRAKEYIEAHYQENLTLEVLAGEIHMNPFYFSSFFKKQAGENFKDYVNKIRIEHAVSLLLSTDRRTYEIAAEVGFRDVRSFTKLFVRIYGETPASYRKRILQKEID